MTIDQIKNAGIVTNKWDTLQDVCNAFLFTNEGYFHISPKTTQFYFEESTNLLFVRNYRQPSLSVNNDPDFAEVNIKTNGVVRKYYARLLNGGAIDKTVGKYHHVFDASQITAII